MKIILDEAFNWNRYKIKDYTIWCIGNFDEWKQTFISIIQLGKNPNEMKLDKILDNSKSVGACIIKYSEGIIAFVDHFRCYPLFYTVNHNFSISNNARKLTTNKSILHNLAPCSVEEFMMTGYVTGPNTLVHNIRQLQSGERLIYTKSNSKIKVSRYYRFFSKSCNSRSDQDWIQELDYVMSNVTNRMIERAKDRPIRVTLSAGLDSRIIVCKLHEAKYKNLESINVVACCDINIACARKLGKSFKIDGKSPKEVKEEIKSLKNKFFLSKVGNL